MAKNQALENRIKRLAFEQQRAQKLTDIATEKAGKLLDARDRHQRQLEEKIRLQEMRQIEEDERRLRNLTQNQIAVEKKRRNNVNILTMNQRTKQLVVEKEKDGYNKRMFMRDSDLESKRDRSL